MGSWKRLTATPYQLSECYIHLVNKPEKNDEALREKFGELQAILPQLGEHDLRQAKADIIYLQTVLE